MELTKTISFERALLEEGWSKGVKLTLENGIIVHIQEGANVASNSGIAVPAMHNVHSHSFQRAMAGLTEKYAPEGKDDFWGWRETMYGFAEKITSEELESITSQLYVELLKEGYATVGEFHYLHHDIWGNKYSDVLETSKSIFRASDISGIGLCHLPVLYQTSGFGKGELNKNQKRFYNDNQSFEDIFQKCLAQTKGDKNKVIGLAFHSLRAVDKTNMKVILTKLEAHLQNFPIHIHIAEQTQEVLDCLGHYGSRPVNWLLENFEINGNWCLVHATHLTDEEILNLSRVDAIVGVCPTTEANLGDGMFPIDKYLKALGGFAIGSDSNIGRDPREELRMLEYGQRLSHQKRTVLGKGSFDGVGRFLWQNAARGGAQALGFNSGSIGVGKRADIAVLKQDTSQIFGKSEDEILDGLIFMSGPTPIKDLYVAGKKVISEGKHPQENAIWEKYKTSLKRLMDQ